MTLLSFVTDTKDSWQHAMPKPSIIFTDKNFTYTGARSLTHRHCNTTYSPVYTSMGVLGALSKLSHDVSPTTASPKHMLKKSMHSSKAQKTIKGGGGRRG